MSPLVWCRRYWSLIRELICEPEEQAEAPRPVEVGAGPIADPVVAARVSELQRRVRVIEQILGIRRDRGAA